MVIPTDVNLITAIIQTGALGGLIWLVIDTRREAQRREDRLLNIIENYSKELTALAAELREIAKIMGELSRWLNRTEG